ncbi:MAG: HEPN domain-containing protein [Anaerolineales bacterium]|nr:HEPN domain-containing protein [Anaerolineales bacterium]
MAFDAYTKGKIAAYMSRARQTLDTRQRVMAFEDYITAVNRAYYAIFYATNALLTTKGLERSKHSGVIAAFRQHFVKTGIVPIELSDFFGEAMSERHIADYDLQELTFATAQRNLQQAEQFISQIEVTLRQMGAI